MSNFTITVEAQPKAEERRKIFDELQRSNAAQINDSGLQNLTVFLRDAEDNVVGGL